MKRNKESYRTSGYIENHAQLNALQKRLGDDLLESSVRIELEKVLLWRMEKDREGDELKRYEQNLDKDKSVLEAQIKK